MKMKLLDQEQTQASTRTSNDVFKSLLMFFVPILAMGSILCITFGIGMLVEGRALGAFLCLLAGNVQVGLLVFLMSIKMIDSYVHALRMAGLSFFLASILVMLVSADELTRHSEKIENTREGLMSEQGYENLEKQGYENMENRGRSIYSAEKDGKEYLLIVDGMEDDGEMKVKVTPFEKGTEEALN